MESTTQDVCIALLEGRRAKVPPAETDGRTLWLDGERIAWIAESTTALGARRLPERLFTTLASRNDEVARDCLNALLELAGHARCYGKPDDGTVPDGEEIDPRSVRCWRLPLAHQFPDDTLTVRGDRVAALLQEGIANA